MLRFLLVLSISVTIMTNDLLAQHGQAETGFLDRSVIVDSYEYKYQIYVPRNYRPTQSWPAILVLHGYGERGLDGLIPTEVGLGSAIRRDASRFPAITIFPQTPGTWDDSGIEIAMAALDQTMAEYEIDSSRLYLTGLSMGGNGTWHLAFTYPDTFAAAVVVCGWVSNINPDRYTPIFGDVKIDPFSEIAGKLRNLPLWIFHGDEDPVISVEESRKMNMSLILEDANVQYTEFAETGHNSWDAAYSYGDLTTWLFNQRRPE